MDRILDTIARHLQEASRLLFITGAGISADSGLPTYRGVAGLYDDEHCEDDVPIETALSGHMFNVNPSIPWKHISRIERACRGVSCNRAHEVIASLETTGREVWVLTQNVDGLHRRAGSSRVIEIHGNVSHLFCPQCPWGEDVTNFAHLRKIPPPCPRCGSIIRPDVVLFGEMLDPEKVEQIHHQMALGFDIVFSIGTSSLFPYIVAPVHEARARGTPTVEINPDTTTISSTVDHHVPLGAAEAMESLYLRLTRLDTRPDV